MSDKKKILIVDDEEDIVEMLQLRLEANGFDVDSASNGRDGIDKAAEIEPDLILLDVMMPIMTGYEACKELKSRDDLKSIPVLMLSARALEKDEKQGEAVGADAYVSKPYTFDELLDEINALLG